MGIDPMADAEGQQGLSPYHAMACNPSTMVDPLGLFATGPAHEGMYPRKPGLAPVPFYYALLCMPPSKIFDMMSGSVFYSADQKMEAVLSGLYSDMAAHDAVILQRYNAIRQEIWQNAVETTAGLIAGVRRDVLNGGRANYSQDGSDPAEKKRNKVDDSNNDIEVDGWDYANTLQEYYESNIGGTYHLSIWRFSDILQEAKEKQAIDFGNESYDESTGLYSVSVNLYKTSYWAAFGRATLKYKKIESTTSTDPWQRINFVQFYDTWDLDTKPWGTRSVFSEIVTRYYNYKLTGKKFDVKFP